MRILPLLSTLLLPSVAAAQEYVEPEWVPPAPPEYEAFCADEQRTSQPVISYRVAPDCTLTDIQAVGEYRYGTEQVRSEVSDLSTSETVRRFVSGNFILYKEVRIELHSAREPTATLVCTTDMMGREVIDARIVRERRPGESSLPTVEQPVPVADGALPNLGVFTYTNTVTYSLNNCPE